MWRSHLILPLIALACFTSLSFAQDSPTLLSPAAAFAPSPATNGPVTITGNTTGSLGNLCSSQAGIQTALQGVASNQDSAGLNVTIPAGLADPASLSQVAQIAWNYIVTYPLPFIAKSLAANSGNATAINTFYASNDRLADYNITGTVTPNHDTVYNQAFLDLSQGPQIITVPKFDNPKRYWIVPFVDAYLNYYGAVGSDFNSTAGQYLVLGRDAPANATYGNFTNDRIFRSPTDLNWIIGRVLVLNDSDLPTALNFSRSYSISPYNPAVNGSLNASSKAAIISRSVNGSGYGIYKNSAGFLDGFTQQPAQWFNVSSIFLSTDPPVNGSTSQRIDTLNGLVQNATNTSTNGAFQLAQQVATKCVTGSSTALKTNTGWSFSNTSGIYTRASGTDYLLRAQDSRYIPTALPPSEVIYFQTRFDSTGQILDASNGANYTLTFPLPLPAKAFWSLTIYNATSLLLFKNPIDRYNIADRTQGLVLSGPGNNTLEVFVSASQPANGTAQFANWLPAPTDAPFLFLLRTYLPPANAIAGQYAPPAIIRTTAAPAPSTASTG